jgi:hypothetical protein
LVSFDEEGKTLAVEAGEFGEFDYVNAALAGFALGNERRTAGGAASWPRPPR